MVFSPVGPAGAEGPGRRAHCVVHSAAAAVIGGHVVNDLKATARAAVSILVIILGCATSLVFISELDNMPNDQRIRRRGVGGTGVVFHLCLGFFIK